MEFLYWVLGYVGVGFVGATLVHIFTDFYADVDADQERALATALTIFYPITAFFCVMMLVGKSIKYSILNGHRVFKGPADYLRNRYRVKAFNYKNAKAWKGEV